MVVPAVAIAFINATPAERHAAISAAISTTRDTTEVMKYAIVYADMLISVINGASIPEAAQAAGEKIRYDIAREVARGRADPMTACYISSSFPAMLIYAYKYGDSYSDLLLNSANGGGENVARGSLLGALAGAQAGMTAVPDSFRDDLMLSEAIQEESAALVNRFVVSSSPSSQARSDF
jgi:ADP-ribosylglycohydrolase